MQDLFKKHNITITSEQNQNLLTYRQLLNKWQNTINLVGKSTLDEADVRHFLDSAQLLNHIPNKDIVMADMGTGAGFPGLVLAMLGIKEVHLIESDVRKVQFLRQVSRETKSTNVHFDNERVQTLSMPDVQLITARALAPLKDLLAWAETLNPNASCLFLKGEKAHEEISDAQKHFVFDPEIFQSKSDSSGNIIFIKSFKRK